MIGRGREGGVREGGRGREREGGGESEGGRGKEGGVREGGRGRKGEGRVWCGVIGRGEAVVRGREGEEGGRGKGGRGRKSLLGAVSSSCDGGHGRHCCVVWSWCGGSAVVVLGHRHSQCWALVGVSGWWCWGLVAIHWWWNWVLIAICW